jgi:hypothetical protein
MKQKYLMTLIITAWVAMMLVTALFVGVESAIGWTVIAGASMLPPLGMLWTWRRPGVTPWEINPPTTR